MPGNKKEEGKEPDRVGNYLRTEMQKDMTIRKLREQGCRITKQRMILLDVILGEESGRKNPYGTDYNAGVRHAMWNV